MKIGVFDSGKGGLSVAKAVRKHLPEAEVVFRDDVRHLPYGSKPPEELLGYVVPILEEMVETGCKVVIIACNTVTTTLITALREHITVPLIGIEPMVKPAAELTKTGIIAVCATPTTLASPRYAWLKETFAPDITVLEPDCSRWALMIETDTVDREEVALELNKAIIAGADVVVLACTHYHWIESLINELVAGIATVLLPEEAILRQLDRVLDQLTAH